LTTSPTKRVLSGMRPTGRLHIGHYFGALQNWVKLQNHPDFDCFYFIADWHALTSDYADTSAIAENTLQVTIDYLASGLDPAKSTIFVQSFIPEHAELHLLLSMVTPLGELERVPTYKEQLENVADKDLHTYGFLGYPVLQTADIVMYGIDGMSLLVPVGEDQVSHVELSRKIVQAFNFHYGLQFAISQLHKVSDPDQQRIKHKLGIADDIPFSLLDMEIAAHKRAKKIGLQNFMDAMGEDAYLFRLQSVLQYPNELLTPTPRIPGLDGRKMSKSYNNAIMLSESDADIRAKTKVMVTDPARKRRTDPGNPDVCPVYDWHKLFSPQETLDWSAHGCRTAGIGCIECKAAMADNLIKWITPVRERRLQHEQNPKQVLEILHQGSAKARSEATKTMDRVRQAILHWSDKHKQLDSHA
jgi:tryptophanyl-tRNA synthetase